MGIGNDRYVINIEQINGLVNIPIELRKYFNFNEKSLQKMLSYFAYIMWKYFNIE